MIRMFLLLLFWGGSIAATLDREVAARHLGLKVVPLTLKQLQADLIGRNIALRQTFLDQQVSKEALLRAASAFDPILRGEIRYLRQRRYDRIERAKKFKKATQTCPPGARNPGQPNCILFDEGPIRFLEYDRFRPAGFGRTRVEASRAPLFGASEEVDATLSLLKRFRFGAQAELNLTLTYKPTYWTVNEPLRDVGLARVGEYKRPWLVALNFKATAPLPWTRNFGAVADERAVAETLAKLAAMREQWRYLEAVNRILLEGRIAFWRLWLAKEQLHVTLDHLRKVEILKAHAERWWRLGELPDSEFAQIEAEWQRISAQVERDWDTLVRASNRLRNLLNLKEPILFWPQPRSEADQVQLSEALVRELPSHPEQQVRLIELKRSEVLLRQKRHQIRQNLSLTLSLTLKQLGTRFGYPTPGEALKNIFDPDLMDLQVVLNYRWPILQRADRAAFREAHALREAEAMRREAVRRRLERELSDAVADLFYLKQRMGAIVRSERAFDEALRRAARLHELGEITDYELILRSISAMAVKRQRVAIEAERRIALDRLRATLGWWWVFMREVP